MEEIIKTLSEMMKNRVVTTREELERKAVRAALKSKSAKALKMNYDLINEIVDSYIDCPLSLNCIHFSEKVEIGNVTFYHIHTSKPTKSQFEEAYKEYVISKRIVHLQDKIRDIVNRFFSDYNVKNGIIDEFNNKKYKYAVFYSLLNDINEDIDSHINVAREYDGEYEIATLTEKNPNPFIKFFKNHSEKIKAANIKIWVIDVDKNCIDPFIGYPKDFRLIKGFKNPKLASIISSLWRVQVDEIVEI